MVIVTLTLLQTKVAANLVYVEDMQYVLMCILKTLNVIHKDEEGFDLKIQFKTQLAPKSGKHFCGQHEDVGLTCFV